MFSTYNLVPPPCIEPALLSLEARQSGQRSRLCLVSDSTADHPVSAHATAALLAEDGWDVVFLDLAEPAQAIVSPNASYQHQILAGTFQENYWYTPTQSLSVYHWLKTQDFAAVIFQHGWGAGYYATVARRLGLAFQNARLFVWITQPHARQLEAAEKMPAGRTEIERDIFERCTTETVDAVIGHDRAVLDWVAAAGWELSVPMAVIDSALATTSLGAWLTAQPLRTAAPALAAPPVITIGLATYNRPQFLRRALESICAQTYPHFEIIVIDDGSTDPGMAALKAEYASLFAAKAWRWLEQANAGPAVARNRVLEWAKGSYLFFMDDDNIALPGELDIFAKAATASGADIITCIPGLHADSDFAIPPISWLPSPAAADQQPLPAGWSPTGGHLALALFTNPFGDTNALYKRTSFAALGGFSGDRNMAFEDFEYMTRAVAAGQQIEVIPEILYLYLRHRGSRSMGKTIYDSHIKSLLPIAALLPPSLRVLLLALRSTWYEQHRAVITGEYRGKPYAAFASKGNSKS